MLPSEWLLIVTITLHLRHSCGCRLPNNKLIKGHAGTSRFLLDLHDYGSVTSAVKQSSSMKGMVLIVVMSSQSAAPWQFQAFDYHMMQCVHCFPCLCTWPGDRPYINIDEEVHMSPRANLLRRSGGRRIPIAAIDITAPERLPRPHVDDGHRCACAGCCCGSRRWLLLPSRHGRPLRLSTKSARLLVPPLLPRAVGRPARARIPASRASRPSRVEFIMTLSIMTRAEVGGAWGGLARGVFPEACQRGVM